MMTELDKEGFYETAFSISAEKHRFGTVYIAGLYFQVRNSRSAL
jgi:hypothetical protein